MNAPEARSGRPREDLMERSAPLILGAFALVGAFALLQLVLALKEILAVVFLGIVVGTVLGPVTDKANLIKVPRALAVLLIYGVIAGLIVLFFWYAIPEIYQEGGQLADRLGEFQADYEDLADDSPLPPLDQVFSLTRQFLEGRSEQVLGGALAFFQALLYTLTILAVALFWTMLRHPAARLVTSLVTPSQRDEAHRVLNEVGSRLRGFVVAQFAGMLTIGLLTYIGLVILGVPFAFVLATIAFVFEILPILGPWLSYLPALAVALTEGWQLALAVSLLYLGLQQVESYVVTPLVQRHGTQMPELVVLVAVLAGATLMGVLGALVSIPVAVVVATVFMEVFVPWRRRRIGDPDPYAGTAADPNPDA